MPLYSYACEKCGKSTQIICSFSEKTEQEKKLACEHCGNTSLYPVFKINIGQITARKDSASESSGCSGCSGSGSGCGGCG